MTNEEVFQLLQNLHHISLVRLTDSDGRPFNGFLNSSCGSLLQFSNLHPVAGGVLYWTFRFCWGMRSVIVYEDEGIEMISPYNCLSIQIADLDAEFQAFKEFAVIQDEGIHTLRTLKCLMYRRLIMDCLTIGDWMNLTFIHQEEILVNYDYIRWMLNTFLIIISHFSSSIN